MQYTSSVLPLNNPLKTLHRLRRLEPIVVDHGGVLVPLAKTSLARERLIKFPADWREKIEALQSKWPMAGNFGNVERAIAFFERFDEVRRLAELEKANVVHRQAILDLWNGNIDELSAFADDLADSLQAAFDSEEFSTLAVWDAAIDHDHLAKRVQATADQWRALRAQAEKSQNAQAVYQCLVTDALDLCKIDYEPGEESSK